MMKVGRKTCGAVFMALNLVFTSVVGIPLAGPVTVCAGKAKKATVKLNKTTASVKEGKKVTLKLVKKNVKKVKSQKWSSKSKKTAAVNKKGTVAGKKAGKTTIQCKVKYVAKGSKKVLSKVLKCKVTVKKKEGTDAKKTPAPSSSPAAASTTVPAPAVNAGTAAPTPTQSGLVNMVLPNVLSENKIQQNPYLSTEEAMIHNDIYNSDVTKKILPAGICPEIIESVAADSPIAPPAFFYDNYGNAVAPYSEIMKDGSVLSGGIAIRDMDSPDLDVKGKFQPPMHDNGGKYGIQISYSFVDKDNYLLGPTTHGHIVMIRTYDEDGNILPVFEKKLDADIVSAAVKTFGDEIDKNILSITYDYAGNIWFATGGFHKNPSYSKAGFVGFLERAYIDRVLAGESGLDISPYLHFRKLAAGENAENGIGAHPEGCIIETNLSCYLFAAESSEVCERWKYDYESVGGKAAKPETGISGAGLAWGGGSSPTMTDEMVLFTDNQDVVNLIGLDIKTGKEVAKTPVLDLGKDVIVSVENSICVYDSGNGRTSVLVCNWFGAGNANLFRADADSSVQSFDNIYDPNWRAQGSAQLMPGIERVDIVKQTDGTYRTEKVWMRSDLKDTSMIKLSTGSGCYYGYTQDEKTLEWGFIALDYATGRTVMWQPVSKAKEYNNVAVGIMQGHNGNSIYCPTDSKVLLRMQDRFAYLPEQPEKKLDIVKMERKIISQKEFAEASGCNKTPVGYYLSAVIDGAKESQTLAFRVNNLRGAANDYSVYYETDKGEIKRYDKPVFVGENGAELMGAEEFSPDKIYEIRILVKDSGDMDLEKKEGIARTAVVLAK